jgi:ubiquinone/menaquinone biosynthesis C-methylase UbiE
MPNLPHTRRFYEGLATGRVSRGLWGYGRRFDPDGVRSKPSVQRHFLGAVAPLVRGSDTVLDLGCGPGGFLATLAPHCGEIVGVDVVRTFVDKCRETIAEARLPNARAEWSPDGTIPFPPATFDVVTMVDTLHHCDDPRAVLADVRRVLKPGGALLMLEPNILNPALALMCLFDRNEWGVFRLGTRGAYRRILTDRLTVQACVYNGLLIGPTAAVLRRIADFVAAGGGRSWLGWLSPKIFVAARRDGGHAG